MEMSSEKRAIDKISQPSHKRESLNISSIFRDDFTASLRTQFRVFT